jgi:predicted nuclease of predicted toxin-antitoxin system
MDIKYHLDESVANAVATGLEHRGIDVTTSKAAGLIGASDLQQLDYAMKQGRVTVTHDDDFLRIHAAGAEHAGIVYVHQKRLTIGQTVLALLALHRNQSAESMAGRVEFLQSNRG